MRARPAPLSARSAQPGVIDGLLARALRGAAPWPPQAAGDAVGERAVYHGIAGILTDHGERIATWPAAVRGRLRQESLAQAMWDMRHQQILAHLLAQLAASGIDTRILKGTALAYRLFPRPGQRARGDSDLLVAPGDLDHARTVLARAGFTTNGVAEHNSADDRRQESWILVHDDGSQHLLDLHWTVLNSPVMDRLLPLELALDRPCPIPALGPAAQGLPGDLALLHACLHRAKHILSPYYVDGDPHYGGDRLIWLVDIDLLWRSLDAQGRADAVGRALDWGIGPLLGDTLNSAREGLGSPVADADLATLRAAPAGEVARYLAAGRSGERALRDLFANPGLRAKLRYLWQRLFPDARLMRARYRALAHRPLVCLHGRRFLSMFRRRRAQRR